MFRRMKSLIREPTANPDDWKKVHKSDLFPDRSPSSGRLKSVRSSHANLLSSISDNSNLQVLKGGVVQPNLSRRELAAKE